MSTLAEFFQGSDTRLGVFYPTHHLVAVFRSRDIALDAVKKLQNAGFAKSEVIATDGKELIELDREETGPAALVMQAVSRFFGTEQVFTDHDLEHARHGAGFLAAHCPTDAVKNTAWKIIRADAPLDVRYYGAAGIEHFAGDVKTD